MKAERGRKDMDIRPWTYEDIYAIAELEKQCFPDPWTFQMLADSFFEENTLTAAATEGQQLIGYAFLVGAGEDADLANIAVAPACRGRGVAKSLLGALERAAKERGTKRIFLEVRVSNAPAMTLYLSCGYVGRYVRPRYYGDGEDAVIFAKEL